MSRILIVDDDGFVRRLLSDALASAGHQLTEANNGASAVELVKQSRPDVVLLDLFMPTMGGVETLEALVQVAPGLPVVVVSSLDSPALIDQLTRAGARAFVSKPFHPLEIQAAVQQALEAQG